MPVPAPPLRAAVLGTGKIGMDLAEKLHKSDVLDCALVVGRTPTSVGLQHAQAMGLATMTGGIAAFVDAGARFDVIFDASNAAEHTAWWDQLAATGALLVDLTPSSTGTRVVPMVNAEQALRTRHLNLISCGGQTAIPVLHAIARTCSPTYTEVVASAASPSAGRGTRLNIDEYLHTTQDAVRELACPTAQVKALLNLSPARPEPPFRVTATVLAPDIDPAAVHTAVQQAADAVRSYAPGYTVTSTTVTGDRVDVAVEVTAHSSHIPWYAGTGQGGHGCRPGANHSLPSRGGLRRVWTRVRGVHCNLRMNDQRRFWANLAGYGSFGRAEQHRPAVALHLVGMAASRDRHRADDRLCCALASGHLVPPPSRPRLLTKLVVRR